MAVAPPPSTAARNPGPSWGYRVLVVLERWWPAPIFRGAFWVGTMIGMLCMPRQRRESARYLQIVLGRPARRRDIAAHFYAFSCSLMRVLTVSRGQPHDFRFAPGAEADFETVTRRPGTILYGTFHLGDGDLLGYFLTKFGRRIRMVRLRVGNSDDTRWMEERFGGAVRFIWVDKPENMTFALRSAIEEGHSLAMKCDRVEGARKTERFTFLGCERAFPFTIYWLGLLFEVPVVFSFGVGNEPGLTEVWCSRSFMPRPDASKKENLARARAHFQDVLAMAESVLRKHPYAWFNFEPWDCTESDGGAA